MLAIIPAPRTEISPYAPRIFTTSIDPEKLGCNWTRWQTIKIIDETGAEIDIEDDGRVFIAAVNSLAGEKALKMIEQLTKDVKVGELYTGKVVRIINFGAFVEILPGKEGLVHISQLKEERTNRVEDVVSVGDEILVKVTEIDRQGRINLSRKAALREQKQRINNF